MSKLDVAKAIIRENYKLARCGIHNCNNLIDDPLTFALYEDDDLTILICYGYEYFEVFGLSDNEFAELEKYYEELRK